MTAVANASISSSSWVQSWFSRCFPGRSPYRLCALSNLGSLRGLISYPLGFEPRLRLAQQGWLWSAGFAVFVVACAGCAVLAGRAPPVPAPAPADAAAAPLTRARRALDVLVLDAFSFDSIPVHLLTLEAGAQYLRHLAPDGILAIHISNRHLALEPVVRGLAEGLGLAAVRVDNEAKDDIVWRSEWMLLARDRSLLAIPEIQRAASRPAETDRAYPVWTDAFSNLQVFRG